MVRHGTLLMATTNPRRLASIVIALTCAFETSHAQNPLGSERADIGNFRGDIWAVWTSPAGMRQRDLLSIAGTLGAAALASRVDSSGYVWMRHHERTLVMRLLAPIRDSATVPAYEFGSGQYLLPLSALLYTAGRLSHSADLRDAGLGCAVGHLSSLGIRAVVLRSVTRQRPSVTPHPFKISVPGTSEWLHQSFYSGHIANSMACASFMTHRFALGLAEPLPYAFSIAIGLGRLADGHHWISDSVVGGVVGFAIGKAIAERQLRRGATPAAASSATMHRVPWEIPVMQWSVAF